MESFLIYLFIYNIILLNIFIILFTLIKYNNNIKLHTINQLIYIYKSNVILAFSFCIIIFSLAGIPPLAGFFSKFILFMEAIQLN
jgi:NADH-quinone oxidoreductase subunit N